MSEMQEKERSVDDRTHSETNAQRFDRIAAEWDEDPRRTAMARAVAQAMIAAVQPQGGERALEVGAGTGLVTALLAPRLREVVAADNSAGMLAVLERKCAALGLANVRVQACDLARELPAGPFDLVFSSMTLHHIKDVAGLFVRLADVLAPGGRVALADLDAEDGSFHSSDAEGIAHHGFARADIGLWLAAAGLQEIEIGTAHVSRKADGDGRERDYPIFLATARKQA